MAKAANRMRDVRHATRTRLDIVILELQYHVQSGLSTLILYYYVSDVLARFLSVLVRDGWRSRCAQSTSPGCTPPKSGPPPQRFPESRVEHHSAGV
jgi:hypothetical protein